MAKFDAAYFDVLCNWIRQADNGWYDADSPGLKMYCSDMERFLGHLSWYEKKNKDDRFVYIWRQTETEEMYGVKFCKFRLGDIYYPGCVEIGTLPEETRNQKMNRIWKTLGENINPAASRAVKDAPAIIPAVIRQKAKFINSVPKGLFD